LGFSCSALDEVLLAVSSGVSTGLVLSEFKRIVFLNFDERFEPNESDS
jgi:hypothetical protein